MWHSVHWATTSHPGDIVYLPFLWQLHTTTLLKGPTVASRWDCPVPVLFSRGVLILTNLMWRIWDGTWHGSSNGVSQNATEQKTTLLALLSALPVDISFSHLTGALHLSMRPSVCLYVSQFVSQSLSACLFLACLSLSSCCLSFCLSIFLGLGVLHGTSLSLVFKGTTK